MIGSDWSLPLSWLASYALHSTALLGVAWLADAARLLRGTRSREFAWRLAVFGSILTATVHTFAPGVSQVEAPSFTPLHVQTLNVAASEAVMREVASSKAGTTSASLPAAKIAPAPRPVTSDVSTSNVLLLGWCIGAGYLLLRLLASGWLAVRELATRETVRDGKLRDQLLGLCLRETGKRRVPELSEARNLPGPVTLLNGEICMPSWTSSELSENAIDAMLAHELAHVRRRDPLILLAVTILARVLFFQPLNHLACRRLAALAELDADTRAAQLTGNPRALAEALAHCAGQLQRSASTPRALQAGVAMATPRSPLILRVERLLGDTVMKDQHVSRFVQLLGVTALLIATVALPAFGGSTSGAGGTSMHISINDDDESSRMRIEIGKPGYFLHVESDGDVAFNDTETNVTTVEQGGSIMIREKRDGVLHEFEAGNDDGELVRTYSRDGKRMAMDDIAREWLAAVIPAVLRNSAIDVERRVARFYRNGGAGAVLDEMTLIESDHALARYTAVLATTHPLDDAETTRLVTILDDIGSDFELRNVLATVVTSQSLDEDNQLKILALATSIDSDFEAAELVTTITPTLAASEVNLSAWRALVGGIGSDFELRRALAPVFEHPLPTAWQIAALQTARAEIGSDFELRSLLEHAAPHMKNDATLREYVAALEAIGSDFEAREAVVSLVRARDLDANAYAPLLDALNGIGSGFEQLQALLTVAKKMPRESALLQKYRRLAEGLPDHEREQALRAIN